MGKVKNALKKAGAAFMDAMMLEDDSCEVVEIPEAEMEKKKTAAELLTECEKAPEYSYLAIYDEGEIVAVNDPSEAFLDCVETFALVRSFNAPPAGELMMGLKAYRTSVVDYDLGRITELSTWQALVKNGFTDAYRDAYKDTGNNPLKFALKSNYPIPVSVFDLLYAVYPDAQIEDVLVCCNRLEAAKWAVEHGADKFYDGYRESMQDMLSYTGRCPEAREIFKYLYEQDPEEYRKEKSA